MTRPPDEGDRTDLQDKVLSALEKRRSARRTGDQPRKVSAIVLARAFGIRPDARTDDSRKRGVRNVIDAMRKQGHEICSDFKGYWLAVTPDDWATYHDFLNRQGLSRLALEARSKRSPAAAECTGQMAMFATAPSSDNLVMAH